MDTVVYMTFVFSGYFDGTDSGGECGVPHERRFLMPRPRPDEPWYVSNTIVSEPYGIVIILKSFISCILFYFNIYLFLDLLHCCMLYISNAVYNWKNPCNCSMYLLLISSGMVTIQNLLLNISSFAWN